MPERCQLNIRLDGYRELLEEAKEQASQQNISLNQWMIAAIQEKLARPPATPASVPVGDNIQDMIDDALNDRISQLNNQISERLTTIDNFLGICSVETLGTTLDKVLDNKLGTRQTSNVLDKVLDTIHQEQQEEDTSTVLDKVLDIPQEPQEQTTQQKTVEHPDAITLIEELRQNEKSWGAIATRLTEDGFVMIGKSEEPVKITHRNISSFAKSKGID